MIAVLEHLSPVPPRKEIDPSHVQSCRLRSFCFGLGRAICLLNLFFGGLLCMQSRLGFERLHLRHLQLRRHSARSFYVPSCWGTWLQGASAAPCVCTRSRASARFGSQCTTQVVWSPHRSTQPLGLQEGLAKASSAAPPPEAKTRGRAAKAPATSMSSIRVGWATLSEKLQ